MREWLVIALKLRYTVNVKSRLQVVGGLLWTFNYMIIMRMMGS